MAIQPQCLKIAYSLKSSGKTYYLNPAKETMSPPREKKRGDLPILAKIPPPLYTGDKNLGVPILLESRQTWGLVRVLP
jgi:hypothetical protein